MNKQLIALALIVAATGCGRTATDVTPATSHTDAATRLHSIMDSYLEERLAMDPLYATSIGDHRYDDRFTNDISPTHRAAALTMHEKYLAEVEKVDPYQLEGPDRVSREMFHWDRLMSVEGFNFPSHLLPMNQFYSRANTFVQLGSGTSYHPFEKVEDYDNFLGRMEGFRGWMYQTTTNMTEGMEQGIVLPRVLVERMIPQLDAQIVADPEDSVFFNPVRNMPEAFSAEERERLETAYRDAIRDKLVPVYRFVRDFLRDRYLPAARDTFGLGDLPGGDDWYAYLVRLNTTTALTTDRIHAIGLAEVERIHGEMRGVMEVVGFEGSLAEFFVFVNEDPRFYFDDPARLIAGYEALQEPVHAGVRPLFHRFPKAGYEIRPTEAFREKSAAGGNYRSPDPAGTRPGVFFANTYDLSARPSWAMESLFLHEAVPGHHFQNALRIENEDLPRYRRFQKYTAYGEGWALYGESLGRDIGVYEDPYQYFGALSAELWRAIRLVVDTGLHSQGWTRAQVLEFMYANAAVKPARAEAEAERYMAIPGQALGYKIGQLKILELRQRAEVALGKDFDIRDFHSVVLDSGELPMSVLEAQVDHWLAAHEEAG